MNKDRSEELHVDIETGSVFINGLEYTPLQARYLFNSHDYSHMPRTMMFDRLVSMDFDVLALREFYRAADMERAQ